MTGTDLRGSTERRQSRQLPAPWSDKFWNRVARGDREKCWLWQGSGTPKGYGQISIGGRMHYVHRIAYELEHGPVPEGHVVHHECENRACCNPSHLRAVTPGEHNRLHPNVLGPVKARSGYRNVKRATAGPSYEAEVRVEGERHYLGSYPDPELAALVVECYRRWRRGLPT